MQDWNEGVAGKSIDEGGKHGESMLACGGKIAADSAE